MRVAVSRAGACRETALSEDNMSTAPGETGYGMKNEDNCKQTIVFQMKKGEGTTRIFNLPSESGRQVWK